MYAMNAAKLNADKITVPVTIYVNSQVALGAIETSLTLHNSLQTKLARKGSHH